MYREAMEHLIAAPPAACPAASQPRVSPISTAAGAAEENLSKISAGGENDPGVTKPALEAVRDVATTGGAKAEAVAEGGEDSVFDGGRGATEKGVPRASSGAAEGAESSAGSTAGKGPDVSTPPSISSLKTSAPLQIVPVLVDVVDTALQILVNAADAGGAVG